MRVMIPPDAERVSEIRQNGRAAVGIGVLLNPGAQDLRPKSEALLPNARRASRATDDQPGMVERLSRLMRRRFSQNDVRIRAAESKGIDARDTLGCSIRKGLERGRYAQLQLLKIDVRIWRSRNGDSAESGRA